jgi:membrane fusion protein (multidrug efflux system)
VHSGQYLNEGTPLTTLQGVDDSAYVDFAVAQQVAAVLKNGDNVAIFTASESKPIPAKIVAIDARVDSTTRNTTLRAKINSATNGPAPGASVRVEVPAGPSRKSVAIPVSALRKGPQGDHVFVIAADKDGKTRAHIRPVESGTILGDDVLILKGLTAGEQVAASGSFKLREAALVTAANKI